MSVFPRPFVLCRKEDVSGVSGTGDVAEGVVFGDGTVAMRWRSATASTVLYSTLDDALAVHGHDGRTLAVFADGNPQGGASQWGPWAAWKAWRKHMRAEEDKLNEIRRQLAELGMPQ